MSGESQPQPESGRQAAPVPGADGRDLVCAALDLLRGIPPAGGEPSGSPTVARQKENLREWARGLGLLLERLKKNCGRSERGFLGFGEALAKEQVCITL